MCAADALILHTNPPKSIFGIGIWRDKDICFMLMKVVIYFVRRNFSVIT